MKFKEIAPNIFLVVFKTRYKMCSTFMRLQEFYESPLKGIRGKFFTTEEYMDKYAKAYGNFTYTSDWGGFNVPGNVVKNWIDCFKHDFIKKESKFAKKLTKIISKKPFYVIGALEGDEAALDHELAHAYYCLNKKYRKKMDKLLDKLMENTDTDLALRIALVNHRYHKKFFKDEIQANFATSSLARLKEFFGEIQNVGMYKDFKKVFDKYDKKFRIKNGIRTNAKSKRIKISVR